MEDRAEPLWIFGYGSLVWRPAFPFAERWPCTLDGYARRFWQGSPDHRGVPEAPGRVVTLIEAPGEQCWGLAYRVADHDRDRVIAQLDHRERAGFDRLRMPVRFERGRPLEVTASVYIATQANVNFLGPAPVEAMARQVLRSHGPSGGNAEYVLELAAALEAEGARDDHVFELAAAVRAGLR